MTEQRAEAEQELREKARLTDEEIEEEIKKYDIPDVPASEEYLEPIKHIVAIVRKAQLDKAIPLITQYGSERGIRELVEWLYGECNCPIGDYPSPQKRTLGIEG